MGGGGGGGGGIGRHSSARVNPSHGSAEENGLLGLHGPVGLPGHEAGPGGSNLGKSHSFHERSTSEAARAADDLDKRDDVLSKTGKGRCVSDCDVGDRSLSRGQRNGGCLITRADRKSKVGQCLGFCTADFWSSLAYESAEQKLKHCLT